MSGSNLQHPNPSFTFYIRYFVQLEEQSRSFQLNTEDLILLNPNTRTCPIFRTKADAELTKKIYRRVSVLLNERTEQNPWGVSFLHMLDMANDSHLFRNEPGEGLLPLYEGKMFWHFDHRFGSYEFEERSSGRGLAEIPLEKYLDPDYIPRPRYWVPKADIESRLHEHSDKNWLIAFRDVTSAKLLRTSVFSLLPRVGANHKTPLIFLNNAPGVLHVACFLAVVNSLTFDYVTRQKIGGMSLSYFILNQLPVLPPDALSAPEIAYIVPRVLELVYTAWDMAPFAQDVLREQGSGVRGRNPDPRSPIPDP